MRQLVLIIALLLAAALGPAVGATQQELLLQGIAALHDKDPAQQAQGASILESVIANAPTSPEAGPVCYQLGCYYKADREKSLAYFRQGYGIPGKDQSNAGVSVAHTLVAIGRKVDAAAAFEDVGTKFPDKANYAFYRAGMCWLGESRGKIQSLALRNKAKEDFAKSVATGNLEAKLQLLGMRWEDCDNAKAKWEELIPDLESFAHDSKAPAYARARAFLMMAERSLNSGQNDDALTYSEEVLAADFKGCRAEQAWALLMKAGALEEMGKWDEAIPLYDRIYSEFTDADNFATNNVRAAALHYKGKGLKRLGAIQESAAVMEKLRQEYPSCMYVAGRTK
jgi:tetratricopeptide (TPR) repeat protein